MAHLYLEAALCSSCDEVMRDSSGVVIARDLHRQSKATRMSGTVSDDERPNILLRKEIQRLLSAHKHNLTSHSQLLKTFQNKFKSTKPYIKNQNENLQY